MLTALTLALTMAGPLAPSPSELPADAFVDLRPSAIVPLVPTATMPSLTGVGLITTSKIDDPAHPTASIGVTFTFGP